MALDVAVLAAAAADAYRSLRKAENKPVVSFVRLSTGAGDDDDDDDAIERVD